MNRFWTLRYTLLNMTYLRYRCRDRDGRDAAIVYDQSLTRFSGAIYIASPCLIPKAS